MSNPNGWRCKRCGSTHIVKNGTKAKFKDGKKLRVQMWVCQECGKDRQGDVTAGKRR